MNNKNVNQKEPKERMIRVEIADVTGHTALMLPPEQAQEYVEKQEEKWIFVDNMLVRENDLEGINWAEVESVRVMPGLVGGAGSEDLSQPLLERILGMSSKWIFTHEGDEPWKNGRTERARALIGCFQDSLDSNHRALELLDNIFQDNPDSIRVGRNNIIIIGQLASYCIPIEDLLMSFHNVYSGNSSAGFRPIEVHPKDHWIENHKLACIQVDSESKIPSIDTLIGLILGLLNDNISFTKPEMGPLRTALIELYGLGESPILKPLLDLIAEKLPLIQWTENEFIIKGTHGWKWFVGFSDPEVEGFSISSNINDGPRRLVVEDTKRDDMYWGDIFDIICRVQYWPRLFKNGEEDGILDYSAGFRRICEIDSVFSRIKSASEKRAKEANEKHIEEWFN